MTFGYFASPDCIVAHQTVAMARPCQPPLHIIMSPCSFSPSLSLSVSSHFAIEALVSPFSSQSFLYCLLRCGLGRRLLFSSHIPLQSDAEVLRSLYITYAKRRRSYLKLFILKPIRQPNPVLFEENGNLTSKFDLTA